jgi:hypothetical protein
MSTPVLFLVWRAAPNLDDLGAAFARLDGLVHALAFTPLSLPDQPFARDGRGPALTVELAFASERAFAQGVDAIPASGFEAEAMRGRRFAAPDPVFRLGPGETPCTLLVEYSGRCDDPTAWLDHYDAHHPPIMVRFPGVRDVATFRPAPDLALPDAWERGRAMQRNKVVFDSPAALVAALASPVMAEMRADRDAFPPFDGAVTHFPNATYDLLSSRLTPFSAAL